MKYILRQKYSAEGAPGGHQIGTVKIFVYRCLRENFNCGQYISENTYFFRKTK